MFRVATRSSLCCSPLFLSSPSRTIVLALHVLYQYTKYLNKYAGNRGHRDPFQLVARVLSLVWRQLKAPLSLLMDLSSAAPDDDC
jgi:hypothetical protein